MSGPEFVVPSFKTVTYRGNTGAGANLTRPSDTTTYATGDVISAVTSNDHFTFGADSDDESKRVGRAGKGTMTLNAARLWSSANQSSLYLAAELWLFALDIVEVADNSAFAPTDAEMLTCVGIIDFPAASWRQGIATAGTAGNAICDIRNIDLPIVIGRGRLYGQLVVRNSYVPISAEIFTLDLVCTLD